MAAENEITPGHRPEEETLDQQFLNSAEGWEELVEADKDPVLRDKMRKELLDTTVQFAEEAGVDVEDGVGVEIHVTENGHPYLIASKDVSFGNVSSAHGHSAIDVERFRLMGGEDSDNKLPDDGTRTANGLGLSIGNLGARAWLKRDSETGQYDLQIGMFGQHLDKSIASTWLNELQVARDQLGIKDISFLEGNTRYETTTEQYLSAEGPVIEAYVTDLHKIEAPEPFRSPNQIKGVFSDISRSDESYEEGVDEMLFCELATTESMLHQPLYDELDKTHDELKFPVAWGDKQLQVGARFEGNRETGQFLIELYVDSTEEDANRAYVQDAATQIRNTLARSLQHTPDGELPKIRQLSAKVIINNLPGKEVQLELAA